MKLNSTNIEEFLASKPYALVLLDAKWNNNKELSRQFHAIAEGYPGDDFSFGEVDADDEVVKRFTILNVPAICYMVQGQPVKTIIGNMQDIKEHVRWFLGVVLS